MSEQNTVVYRGPGFLSLLTLVFITLKLCGVIHWSWWWVLSPLLVSVAIIVAIIGVLLLTALVCTVLSKVLK